MDTLSFVIGHNKGYKQGRAKGGFLSMEENEAGGMTYELAGTESNNVKYNIAYENTAPSDTSKLWVKTSKPESVHIGYDFPEQEVATVAEGVSAGGYNIETLAETLPQPMYSVATATFGTKVYLFGGAITGGKTNAIQCFDTKTKSVITLDVTLPTSLSEIMSATVGTKVYLLGGAGPNGRVNTIQCFDTETKSITTLGVTLPTVESGLGVATVGTKVYLFGGVIDIYEKKIRCFDTETKSVTTLDVTLPTSGYNMKSAVFGTKVYLFGGINRGTAIRCFDTETKSITTLDVTVPTATNFMCSATVGTKVYLFGGTITGGSYTNEIQCFDMETKNITTLGVTLPTECANSFSAVVGTDVYLLGGSNSGKGYSDRMLRFFEKISLERNVLAIIQNEKGNIFPIVNLGSLKIEIGVDKVYKGNANNEAEPVEAYLYKDNAWTLI